MPKRRWPSLEEVREKTKQHVLDDRMAEVPPYDLEDWEILGTPAPEEPPAPAKPAPVPARSRRSR